MKLSQLGEDAFLRQLQSRFPADDRVPVGIGDDAAAVVLPSSTHGLLTVDALVEGTHFTVDTTPPRFVGRKAVATAASDIAAMGGDASFALLSLVVPRDLEVETLWHVVDGAAERARELGMVLVGGNVSATSGPVVVSVSVVGASAHDRELRRDGARDGDAIIVSGKIGASICGRTLLSKGAALSSDGGLIAPEELRHGPLAHAEAAIRAHIDPEPRLALGRSLHGHATACLDLSDGLAIDLHRLCRASGVGARLEESALPVAPSALAWARAWGRDPTTMALTGGEDYELLFTCHANVLDALRESSDIALTKIGDVLSSADRVELVRRGGTVEPLPSSGWDHFDA